MGLAQFIQQFAGHASSGNYQAIPHDQAYQAYQSAQGQLSPEQFAQAAQQYYQQASPEQRAELAQQFQQGFQQSGSPLAQQWGNVNPQSISPAELAQMHQQTQQQQPDLIHQIFSPGGALGGTASKVAVAGIAAMAAQHFLGGGVL
jgi:small-conductance mechanosensitive channel